MKSSKSLFNQYTTLNILALSGVIVAIELPHLAEYRQFAEQTVRLPEGTLWMPLLGLLVLWNVFVLARLKRNVSAPLDQLVKQTKMSTSSFAFQKKSMIEEEDFLKHFIEGQALKFDEMEQEVQRMQGEVRRIESISNIQPGEYEDLKASLEQKQSELKEVQEQLQTLSSDKSKLEGNLKLTEKALTQSQKDFDAFKYETGQSTGSGVASPSGDLIERVSTTLSLISNLSWRLSQAWADLPPAEIRDGLKEINQKSAKQLEELPNSEA